MTAPARESTRDITEAAERATTIAEAHEARDKAVHLLDVSASKYRRKVERELEAQRARPPRVLLVEDDPSTARVLRRILSHDLGAIVDVTDLEGEAIVRARDTRYDLLVVDLHLASGGDGLSVIREVRNRSLAPLVPIVVVSGVVESGQIGEVSRRAGANRYFSKPVNAEALIEAARELMNT